MAESIEDFKQLRSRFYEHLRENAKGKRIEFSIVLENSPRFPAWLEDDTVYIHISSELMQQIENIPYEETRQRFNNEGNRGGFTTYHKKLKSALGQDVPLNTFSSGFLVPKYKPNRSSVALNVYSSILIAVQDLKPYLANDVYKALLPYMNKLLSINDIARYAFDEQGSMMDREDIIDPIPQEADPTPHETEQEPPMPPKIHPLNLIIFGPPGTGKSWRIEKRIKEELKILPKHLLRITFHPESSYYEFVGSLRPVVGWARSATDFTAMNGDIVHKEPRTYYAFEAGPMSRALELSAKNPKEPVVLLIEEINRANCAAVFGDVFQLLDRSEDGASQYAIQPSTEWQSWLKEHITLAEVYNNETRELKIPANLYIYATMNTSDQSLFYMDTAFRRRWRMEYCGLQEGGDMSLRVPRYHNDSEGVPWIPLMRFLNKCILDHTRSDDKQMGPWFIRPNPGEVMLSSVDFASKVLFYLWSDVFREDRSKVFRAEFASSSFDTMMQAYRNGKPVLLDLKP